MPPLTPSPTSHTYFSQRLRLHYLDWGNAESPHMLLVHGSQDHAHNWDWIAQSMQERYHVVAPDFRGHGDSQWGIGNTYPHFEYVCDLAQLVQQAKLQPKTVIAHSLGGTLALLYAGTYPESVERLIVLEGVGLGRYWRRFADLDVAGKMRMWIEQMRELSGRVPKRYSSLADAFERMHGANPHLSAERAQHLTVHGSNQNEDGSYSWKFDNYTHARAPYDISDEDTIALWERISCPILFINGTNGYDHRVGQDGTLQHFQNAQVVNVDDAGHWVHHDQQAQVTALIDDFLRGAS